MLSDTRDEHKWLRVTSVKVSHKHVLLFCWKTGNHDPHKLAAVDLEHWHSSPPAHENKYQLACKQTPIIPTVTIQDSKTN